MWVPDLENQDHKNPREKNTVQKVWFIDLRDKNAEITLPEPKCLLSIYMYKPVVNLQVLPPLEPIKFFTVRNHRKCCRFVLVCQSGLKKIKPVRRRMKVKKKHKWKHVQVQNFSLLAFFSLNTLIICQDTSQHSWKKSSRGSKSLNWS